MRREGFRYQQIKELSEHENQMVGIVGFPKVLGISKKVLRRMVGNETFQETMCFLARMGMVEEGDIGFRLSQKGKCFIDNIYMALLSEEEKRNLIKTTKIHCIR